MSSVAATAAAKPVTTFWRIAGLSYLQVRVFLLSRRRADDRSFSDAFEFVWGLCLFYSAFRRSWGCVAACYYLLPTGVGTLSPTCRPFSHSHLNRSSSSFGFFYPFFLFFRTAKHTFYLLCPIPTRRTQPRLARFCFHTHTTNIEKTNQQNKTKPKPNKKQNKTHPAIG